MRDKIYAQVQKDCEDAARAFQMQCMVNDMTFNDPRSADDPMPAIASAHAELTLYGGKKAAAPGAPN